MKFAIVRPRERAVQIVDLPDSDDAKALAGLPRDETDNGTIVMGLGYIVHEYAMFDHPQFYFAIGRTLIAGNAVLFAFDQEGRTVDFDIPANRWGGTFLGDEAAVEAAIKADTVDRPQMATETEVYWRWPAPKPNMEGWAQKVAEAMMKGPVQIDDITVTIIPGPEKKP